MLLQVLQPTIAKLGTASAASFNNDQKQVIEKGQTFEIGSWMIVGNHVKVSLKNSIINRRNTWYFFSAHVQISIGDDCIYPIVIKPSQAKAIFGCDVAPGLLVDLNNCLQRFQINTPIRARHFLAQIAHESNGLQLLQEQDDGDYLEWNIGLGNVQKGDGRKFKGAGAIQLTGRYNYQELCNFMKDPKIMDGCEYVANTYPITSAGLFWDRKLINSAIEQGADVKAVTQIVNGGQIGIDDRIKYYNRACKAIPF